MSRLDSAIRRLEAQRACLDLACDMLGQVPGFVIELGLGNGRSYDHLRERLPGREIYVFDRQVSAHPDCIPPDHCLVLGEIRQTLPEFIARMGARSALVHSDIGSGDEAGNARLAAEVGPILRHGLVPGGIVISDQPLAVNGLAEMPPPAGVRPNRYFMYRARSA